MNNIRRKAIAVVAAGAGILAVSAPLTSAGSKGNPTVIEADVLAPVTPPFTGATNAVRGVPGGGAPWVIDRGELRLRADGSVKADIRGLVIDPAFPNPAVAGINPVPQWKITVSCLTTSGGANTPTNVSSAPFAADVAGNAKVDTMVDLPHPCVAPVVFVAAAAGAWFAVTGA
jgi:hypothetical protein